MQASELARLIQEKLGPDSAVIVTRETGASVELRIERAGRVHFRSTVGESPADFTASLAERIAASIPR